MTETTGQGELQKTGSTHTDLPGSYGRDRVVLMVRDPRCVHVYWEVTGPSASEARRVMGLPDVRRDLTLRMYKLCGEQFNGFNATRFFDVAVAKPADQWYVQVDEPGRSYCAEIGVLAPTGKFRALARSNSVTTPRDRTAPADAHWGDAPEAVDRLQRERPDGTSSTGRRPPK